MAKDPTREQREHRTHTGGGIPSRSVSSALLALNEKAGRDRKHRFRSLLRMITVPMLHECFHRLHKNAASGVDGVSWSEYEEGLSERLVDLHERIHSGRYRSRPVRRRYIPKAGGKRRPLGIPALEDKIVQDAARRILESIYERDFLDCSVGYRPGRGPRAASQRLQHELYHGHVHWVVEADIKGFFENVDHDWLERMLKQRIDDRSFLRLIRKWLKAGVMQEDAKILHPATGTPQGGIISPILANIYLHYVLDLWIEHRVRRKIRGNLVYMRYADDFVVGFEYGPEAEHFLSQLKDRLEKFCLTLAEDKSGIVRFSRHDRKGSGKFTFLGFDFYWGKTKKGLGTIRRRTNSKKLRQALNSMKDWLKSHRHIRMRELVTGLNQRLSGHFNYYGVIGNSGRLYQYWLSVERLCFKWRNRRSQRRSYNWTGFAVLWQTAGIIRPRIMELPYQEPSPRLNL